jgi:hypothetical protein
MVDIKNLDRATLREVKLFRLGQLVTKFPQYSYSRLNPILKKEFGSGLRKQYTLYLIRGIRPVLPVMEKYRVAKVFRPRRDLRHDARYQQLKRKGLADWEALHFAAMKDVSPEKRQVTFDSGTWQDGLGAYKRFKIKMIKEAMRGRGLDKEDARILVAKILLRLFRAKKYSPYDFLKLEYKPPRKLRTYEEEARQKAREKIRNALQVAAGRKRLARWV